MKIKYLLLTIALTVLHQQHIKAQIKQEMFNPERYSVTSFGFAADARSASLGDQGVATEADVNSQYWNPAKYPFNISRAGVALNYTPWLRQLVNDMYLANLTGFYRIGEYSAVSASIRYFSLGEVQSQSREHDAGIVLSPYEMSVDAAYSIMLSEHFSLGAALRWIYSDITYKYDEDNTPGSAFAADLALYYQNYLTLGDRECQLGLGLNLSNIGSKIRFGGSENSEFIPAIMRLGTSLVIPIDEYNRLGLMAEAHKLLVPTYPLMREGESQQDFNDRLQKEYYDISSINGIFKSFKDAPNGIKEELQEVRWSLGAEYVYNDRFSLRAGYHHESENKGNMKYFTAGAGFKMNVFSLDAAYVIATAKSNPLDKTLRFTLTFDMDGINDLFKK